MELYKLLEKAKEYQSEINSYREYLHKNPEIGMNLSLTKGFVKKKLSEMGYEPVEICESGIVACTKGKKKGKVFLLRADMDALPIKEETELEFKSLNGNMHACGHDMHTSMLLGAAKILKEYESELEGTIKLMFQPGEETGDGAKAMVKANVLSEPKVDAAMMIHVIAGEPIPGGMIVIPGSGTVTASSDTFRISVTGKGGHGAYSEKAVDPINVATHLHTALQAINSREISAEESVALTIGKINGGTAPNIIPNNVTMEGTIRAFSQETRQFVKKRLMQISESIAKAFRAEAKVEFLIETSSVVNDGGLVDIVTQALQSTFQEKVLDMSRLTGGKKNMGSEDFAEISINVPSVALFISAGSSNDGYTYPLHHPKAIFDEKQLYIGSAVYAICACAYLEKNKQ